MAERYYRKVFRIRAEDSPNVRAGLLEQAAGLPSSGTTHVPGLLGWAEYRKRRALWDPVRQCVGLDAAFYEGAEVLLFPAEWLNRAEARWQGLRGKRRQALSCGVDPAEGGDRTVMAAVDADGLLELESLRTPDTSVIQGRLLAFLRRHRLGADRCWIDRGGGGKQLADRLRAEGHAVHTVAFGEAVNTGEPRRGLTPLGDRRDAWESRGSYKNRRAQLYGELRLLLDPSGAGAPALGGYAAGTFALPPPSEGEPYQRLRHQLALIPLTYDGEGQLVLLPKRNPRDPEDPRTLTKVLGGSPDEADALVLAVHGLLHPRRAARVGAALPSEG